MPSREKDASDYDLERFIEIFDKAMTSDDPRVVNALRQLMMMVILTDSNGHESTVRKQGPLRRMQTDLHDIYRAVSSLRDDFEQYKRDNHRQTAMERIASSRPTWPTKPEDFNLTPQELSDIQTRIAKKLNSGTI